MPPTEQSPLLPSNYPPSIISSSTTLSSQSSSSSSRTSAILRDIIIGFSDGLTVPFSLTAGLSSLGSTKLVIIGGLAELFSGMISMGLGAYLAGVTEWEAYLCKEGRMRREGKDGMLSVIEGVLGSYGVTGATVAKVVEEVGHDEEGAVRMAMSLGLSLEKPDVSHAFISGVTMASSYFIGGLIPMLPYFFMTVAHEAMTVSIAITLVVLMVFGYAKSVVVGASRRDGIWGALMTVGVGVAAAGASYGIVRWLDFDGGDVEKVMRVLKK